MGVQFPLSPQNDIWFGSAIIVKRLPVKQRDIGATPIRTANTCLCGVIEAQFSSKELVRVRILAWVLDFNRGLLKWLRGQFAKLLGRCKKLAHGFESHTLYKMLPWRNWKRTPLRMERL